MRHSTRKEFLQTSSLLLATVVAGSSFDFLKKKPLLSFSTLGCPDWNFTQITNFAVKHGYKGIEVRGIQREMNLIQCEIFKPQNIKATLQLMQEKKLRFVNLGSSATMHFSEGAERKKNLDEGKRYIDLAQQLNCPYIRVFPNLFPKEQERNQTIDLISKGLVELGEYAKGSNVMVLMETHGELVQIDDLEKIMQSANHPQVGLVWDFTNMWTITKEAPATMYTRLKKYIFHTHIKDAKLVDGKPHYTLLGKGDVPILDAVSLLANGGYKGYYSFEWEKLWHPEIEEPEIAIADYPLAMKKHFNRNY
jgi:sugar phosphate isomerase/epimerase